MFIQSVCANAMLYVVQYSKTDASNHLLVRLASL